eukprot:SAG31_NODE_4326_length_3354_cov_11.627035_4_plen_342_part_00
MRASKRPRKVPAESSDGVATLLLSGSAGVYAAEVLFNGEPRAVLLDTGSPLSWFAQHAGDGALPTHGQRDGDRYADGCSIEGEFRYAELRLSSHAEAACSDVTVLDAGCLLVHDSTGTTGPGTHQGIVGLSIRQAGAFVHDGKPHPGDLIVRLLQQLPSRVISFSLDRAQAQAAFWTAHGPSSVKFGGLHGDEDRYVWTAPVPRSAVDWIVEMPVSFAGRGGESEPSTVRVLVDTGCSNFKVTPALGKAMSDQWGMQVEAPCPARHELENLCVRFIVGGERLEVPALDLILHDEDDDRQCNRIRLDGGLESHDMVFGQALLAGLEAVAFCYATRRIGFAPR